MIKLQNILIEAHNTRIVKIANSKNKKEIANIRDVLKHATWTDKEIDDAVKKYKKEEDDDAKKVAKEKEEKARKAAEKRANKPKGWNAREYKKWIKGMQGNGGRNHSADMAQNARYEKGLIDYVKKQIRKDYGDETPLERIQWDIEA